MIKSISEWMDLYHDVAIEHGFRKWQRYIILPLFVPFYLMFSIVYKFLDFYYYNIKRGAHDQGNSRM